MVEIPSRFHLKVIPSPLKSIRNIKRCWKEVFETVFVRKKLNRRGKVRVYFEKKFFAVKMTLFSMTLSRSCR